MEISSRDSSSSCEIAGLLWRFHKSCTVSTAANLPKASFISNSLRNLQRSLEGFPHNCFGDSSSEEMKRSASQSGLFKWLIKTPRGSPAEELETSSMESVETVDEVSSEPDQPTTSAEVPSAAEPSAAVPFVHPLDFGNVFNIGVENLSDEQRLKFLTEFYTPPAEPASAWPSEVRMTRSGPSTRHLRPDHLQRPESRCLAYSPSLGGLFCRYCTLFIAETDAQRHHFGTQKIALVHEPLKKFSRMFGKDGYITTHVQRDYHKFSTERAERFVSAMRTPGTDIQERLHQDERERIENRRRLLQPMVETVLVLGRCGLAFRGHRDSGPVIVPERSVSELDPEQGNFRTMLGYRAMYDRSLADHLEKGGRNAQYSSKKIQNEIIDISGRLIQREIVGSVQKAKFFSVLADETSDAARLEQLSISVRFISKDESGRASVEEKFLTFVEAADCSGPALAELILSTLTQCGLDTKYLVGQGYDGATSMSGVRGGVQSLIRQRCPHALYVHCCAHVLNLTLVKSSNVVPIRHAFGVMAKISAFFRTSPKRTHMLKDAIEKHAPENQRRALKNLCETRWVERAEACLSFKSLFLPVVAALTELAENEPDAHSYVISLCEERFVFALCLLSVTMGALKTLSEQLQSAANTLPKALDQQRVLVQQLRMWIEKDEGVGCFTRVQREYHRIVHDMKAMESEASVAEIGIAESASESLKSRIYSPFLEGLITELNERFSPHFILASKIRLLLPNLVAGTSFEDLRETFEFYAAILPHQDPTLFETEYEAWKCKWVQQSSEEDLMKVLDSCDDEFFPIVRALLQILATLPVSTATPERTFSSLKILKTYLRNSMTEDRLTGLALLYIHRKVAVDIEEVIDEFVKQNRRISFT